MLKFIFTNTLIAFRDYFFDTLNFIYKLLQPILRPWSVAYISVIYLELIKQYLDLCKKNNVPYIDPPENDVSYTVAGLKYNKYHKSIMGNVYKQYKYFYFKLLIAPYSIDSDSVSRIKKLSEDVVKHNLRLDDTNKVDIEKAMRVYYSIFHIQGA